MLEVVSRPTAGTGGAGPGVKSPEAGCLEIDCGLTKLACCLTPSSADWPVGLCGNVGPAPGVLSAGEGLPKVNAGLVCRPALSVGKGFGSSLDGMGVLEGGVAGVAEPKRFELRLLLAGLEGGAALCPNAKPDAGLTACEAGCPNVKAGAGLSIAELEVLVTEGAADCVEFARPKRGLAG